MHPRVTMPSPLPFLLLLLLLSVAVAITVSSAAVSPPSSMSAGEACKASFYPKLCRALLSHIKLPTNPYDYGRLSVNQALKQAKRTAKIIDTYLAKGGQPSGGAGRARVGSGALNDCRQLAELNADYLSEVQANLRPRDVVLDQAGVGRVKTLMSALVTNQQTCYDGLVALSSFRELYGEFREERRLYVVALELVTYALAANVRKPAGSVEPPVSSVFHGPAIGQNLLEGNFSVVPLRQRVWVAQNGTGNFTTIKDAVAFAPNGTSIDDGYFAIFIGPGVYEENVLVATNKKNLIMIGSGMNQTVITGNHTATDDRFSSTYNSATFAVHGERFIAMDITFENTAGPEKHQAVALRNNADLSTFYRCKFLGYQDTLYAHSNRQFYRDCEIYGTVDFIFGNAACVFQHCNIYARKPLPNQFNVITAQGRKYPDNHGGISIHNCSILASDELASELNKTKTYLGRPWKKYSRTVYMQSYIDNLIDPAGWVAWNGDFALDTLFYGEFVNHGAGAHTSQRVQWPGYNLMDESQAQNFTVSNFINGDAWVPSIPHSGGLL